MTNIIILSLKEQKPDYWRDKYYEQLEENNALIKRLLEKFKDVK